MVQGIIQHKVEHLWAFSSMWVIYMLLILPLKPVGPQTACLWLACALSFCYLDNTFLVLFTRSFLLSGFHKYWPWTSKPVSCACQNSSCLRCLGLACAVGLGKVVFSLIGLEPTNSMLFLVWTSLYVKSAPNSFLDLLCVPKATYTLFFSLLQHLHIFLLLCHSV